jgi:predicted CXXCH cytochrome family protein
LYSDSLAIIQHTPFKERSCDGCHVPHAGKVRGLLTASTKELCGECHEDVIDAAGMTSTHLPVQEGECGKCHSPHSGKLADLLLDKQPRLCLNCHSDIGAMMTNFTAHPPAEEDCGSCHNAHSSEFSSLLAQDVPAGCLECHDGDDSDFKSLHLQLAGSQIDCRKCHDAHASEDQGLVRDNSHAPFAERMCDACHTEPAREGGDR